MEQFYEQIIGMSYPYFDARPATPDTIHDFIRRMKSAYPEHPIDDKKLFNMLETIHSVALGGDAQVLEDKTDHEEWFNPDSNAPLNRDFEWHFWDHYKQYLIHKKNWPSQIVSGLDRYSSQILSRMEDPFRSGAWDRRGMVVGNVQSGKTANYTALVTKAVDAGYKLVVVLAGVHNSLRSQTQDRLNEEFLGYDLDRVQKLTGNEKRIGVRRMFPNHRVVNTLTSSADKGDFKAAVARQAGTIPSLTGDPIILIVKKHVGILKNLIDWATSLAHLDASGNRRVRDIPFLLIDDECDYASVNTKKPERDEDGRIIEDWDPAKTNLRIRELLSSFDKSVYVGYTATPYANIFIHKDDPHPKYGEDIFPKHFLVSLPPPTNYVGPEEVFGLKGDPDVGIQEMDPLPVLRDVSDASVHIPNDHKRQHNVIALPDSLITAIKSFILVCAARRLRGVGVPHNSMLIHVTRYTRIQMQVKDLVDDILKSFTARIMSGSDRLADFQELWEADFLRVSLEMKNRGFLDAKMHDWDDIRGVLFEAVKNIKIKGINGEIADTLDYRQAELQTRVRIDNGETVPWHERGISVIAIGGDKLSRGLTLDGLSISYYLRATRMYDTLMQMGRWFGYRDGYNDLCRIFTTDELVEWYRHIALANRELRNEFDYMAAIHSRPEHFGLKVRSHPGRLTITAAGKSRATEKVSVTFEGKFPKTIIFDPRESSNNRNVVERMIAKIGRKPDRPVDVTRPRYHWENVDTDTVIDFLRGYRTQEIEKKIVDPVRIAEYIEKQEAKGELANWNVVLVSIQKGREVHSFTLGGYEIGSVLRKPNFPPTAEKISIGTLTSPSDETLDMTPKELAAAREFDRNSGRELKDEDTPSSITIRHHRPKTRALLLIYFPACKDPGIEYGLSGDEITGFAISFPASDTAVPIEYVVNSVYVEEEMAG